MSVIDPAPKREHDVCVKWEDWFFTFREDVVKASREFAGFSDVDWSFNVLRIEFEDGLKIAATPFWDGCDGVPIEIQGPLDDAPSETFTIDWPTEWVDPDQPNLTIRKFWLLIQMWKAERDDQK